MTTPGEHPSAQADHSVVRRTRGDAKGEGRRETRQGRGVRGPPRRRGDRGRAGLRGGGTGGKAGTQQAARSELHYCVYGTRRPWRVQSPRSPGRKEAERERTSGQATSLPTPGTSPQCDARQRRGQTTSPTGRGRGSGGVSSAPFAARAPREVFNPGLTQRTLRYARR